MTLHSSLPYLGTVLAVMVRKCKNFGNSVKPTEVMKGMWGETAESRCMWGNQWEDNQKWRQVLKEKPMTLVREKSLSRNDRDVVHFRGRWGCSWLQMLPFIESQGCVRSSTRHFACVITLIFLTTFSYLAIYSYKSQMRKWAWRDDIKQLIHSKGRT